jgi:HEAT repeat protein
MKRAAHAFPLLSILVAVACGSPPEPAVARPVDPPLVIAPIDAGVVAAPAAPENKAPAATSEYLELLRGIDGVEPTPDQEKVARKGAFEKLRELGDPRAADALAAYLDKNPKPRWRTEAAITLAELGDLRAVPHLAWRLGQDPLKLYDAKSDPELRQDDQQRIVAARMLADLATLRPDKQEEIGRAAEPAIFAWVKSKPQPHANAMRVLALAGSPAGIARLRAWADPAEPIPKEGAMAFSPAWATAQVALRYLGLSQHGRKRDEAVWALLSKQLGRRPAAMDATMEALLQGGVAVRGMSLRALTLGAAQGFAEMGDPKAVPLLVAFIEEQKNNEQARYEACFALSSIAAGPDLKALADKVKSPVLGDPKKELIRACLIETLTYGEAQGVDATLLPLVEARIEEVRDRAAVAIGLDGVDDVAAKRLVELLRDQDVRVHAALALLLGGTQAQAAAAVDAISDDAELEALKVAYSQAFGRYTESHRARGATARWVANAEACSSEWPRLIVSRWLRGVQYDAGPGTLTRVVLRGRLLADARATDAKKKNDAILVLQAMGERGALSSLGAPLRGPTTGH